MRRPALILAASVAAALSFSSPAAAFEATAAGIGSGVLAGAVVAGPIGAVVGGVTGGYIGSRYERPRTYAPRRRYVRHHWRAPRRADVYGRAASARRSPAARLVAERLRA